MGRVVTGSEALDGSGSPDPGEKYPDEQRWAVVFSVPADANRELEAVEVARRLEEIDLEPRLVRENPNGGGEPDSADDSGGAAEEAVSLLHVVVPPEQAHDANVEVGLFTALSQSQAEAGSGDMLNALGIQIDDLSIAEIAATSGPTYELDDFDDVTEVRALLASFDAASVRWAVDRQGRLLVHYNDEAKADSIIALMFDEIVEDHDTPPEFESKRSDEILDAEVYDAPAAALDRAARPRGRGVADFDGRPAIDDLTGSTPVVEVRGTPWWAVTIGAVMLVAVFIVFVV